MARYSIGKKQTFVLNLLLDNLISLKDTELGVYRS